MQARPPPSGREREPEGAGRGHIASPPVRTCAREHLIPRAREPRPIVHQGQRVVTFVRDFLTASLFLPSPLPSAWVSSYVGRALAALVMMARIRGGESTPVCRSGVKHHSFDLLLSVALPVGPLLTALFVFIFLWWMSIPFLSTFYCERIIF